MEILEYEPVNILMNTNHSLHRIMSIILTTIVCLIITAND